MKNSTRYFAPLCIAVLALLIVPGALAAGKDRECSNRNLEGTFAYTVTGEIKSSAGVPEGLQGAFAAVGRISFDGRGNVSTKRTLSANGFIVENDLGSGTYTVAEDCSAIFTIFASGLGQLRLNLEMDDSGDEIRAIVTNVGYVLTLQGKRTRPEQGNRG